MWNLFEKTHDLCMVKLVQDVCVKIYSLGSDKPKQQTICSLQNHLSVFHKKLYDKFLSCFSYDQ